MIPFQQWGDTFSATVNGTANSIASVAGSAGRVHYVTDVSGSADDARATIVVRAGSTILWQDKLALSYAGGTATNPYALHFVNPLKGTSGGAVTVTVGSATSSSWANIAGFTI